MDSFTPEQGYQEALRRIETARIHGEISLNLAGISLRSLPPEIGQLKEIGFLDLSNNMLSSLPSELSHLVNLNELLLKNNYLTSLPTEIGQLWKLELLDLSGNLITYLPQEIGQLPHGAIRVNGNPLPLQEFIL